MRDTGLPLLTACLHMCFECIFSVDKHGVQMEFTHRGYQSTPLTLINYHYCQYYLGRIIDFNIIKGKCSCSENPICVHFWNTGASLTQLCASANKALYGPTVGCALRVMIFSVFSSSGKGIIAYYIYIQRQTSLIVFEKIKLCKQSFQEIVLIYFIYFVLI